MSLDGLTGAVETGYQQSAVSAYTVEAWVKTTDAGMRKAIVQDRGSGLGQSLTLGLFPAAGAAGEPFFDLESSQLEIGIYSTTAINDGQLHHVVGTWSGTSGQPVTTSQFHLYVDGNQVTSTNTVLTGSANAPLTGLGGTEIGHHGAWGTALSGTVDEVAIYTTALSNARIAAHHSAGSGYKAAVLADSPVAYFRLDDGAAGPTGPNTIVSKPTYSTTDTVTSTSTSASGTYLMNLMSFSDVEDVAGNRYQCTTDAYSAAGLLTTQNRYTGCGTAPNFTTTGQIQTTYAYDNFGNRVATDDADANAGNSAHLGCSVNSIQYSSCTTFDGVFDTLPTRTVNALGQASTVSYLPTSLGDTTGHGNAAVWSGNMGFGTPGLVSGDSDTAAAFDGVTSYAMLPSSIFGNYPTSGSTNNYTLSFEAWFQTTNNGAILGQVAAIATPPNPGWAPALYVDTSGAIRESLFLHPSSVQNVATGPYNDGHPHHVVATYSNGTDSLYVDGLLKGAQSASDNGYNSSYVYFLGTGYTGLGWPGGNGSWFPFKGTLDEVAVYPTALSGTQVQNHFNAGTNYRSTVLGDSPTAFYRVDDGTTPAANAGYGLWPVAQTDPNGQTTAMGYDTFGRQTSQTLPGESIGLTTTTTTYTVWCAQSGAQTPCIEIDKTQRLNSTTTVTSRAFYDGLGHLVETRSPAPGGQDVVRFSYYDSAQRLIQQSVPYFVTAYTGNPGSAAFAVPDATQSVIKYTYDRLGRTLTTQDALSFTTTKAYAAVCAPAGTGDPGCFEQTLTVDPKGHQGGVLVDGLGRAAYEQRYTGNSTSTYALYATAKYSYDYAADLTKIVQPDGSTQTQFGYDMAGRKTSLTDPDLGAQTYGYDQDSNLTQSVDARGGAGTIFVGYDGLDRPTVRSMNRDLSSPYDTYGYDSTGGGSSGVGRLTSETFTSGALSGSYAYLYDGRGQQTQSTLTTGGTTPPAPAFVQQASAHTAMQTGLGATFGSNVTAGNRIVVVVGVWNSGAVASGVTDSAGNTYTKVAGQVASDGTEETVWTAPITAGGGTKPTVTVTADSSADIGIAVSDLKA